MQVGSPVWVVSRGGLGFLSDRNFSVYFFMNDPHASSFFTFWIPRADDQQKKATAKFFVYGVNCLDHLDFRSLISPHSTRPPLYLFWFLIFFICRLADAMVMLDYAVLMCESLGWFLAWKQTCFDCIYTSRWWWVFWIFFCVIFPVFWGQTLL